MESHDPPGLQRTSSGGRTEPGSGANCMASGLLLEKAMGASAVMLISGLLAGFLIFGLFLAMLASSPRTPR